MTSHKPVLLAAALSVLSVLGARPAFAQKEAAPRRFSLALLVGAQAQSDYHNGLVLFSNGEARYLRLDPGTAVVLSFQAGYLFTDRLAGFLALRYSPGSAEYIERDNLRPDADFNTTQIDLGALYEIVAGPTVRFGAGGGLTFMLQSVDSLAWHDRAISLTTTALGVEGLGALDIALTPLISFRAQLRLGVAEPFLGHLESELARAEGEAAASVDREATTFGALDVGIAFNF